MNTCSLDFILCSIRGKGLSISLASNSTPLSIWLEAVIPQLQETEKLGGGRDRESCSVEGTLF